MTDLVLHTRVVRGRGGGPEKTILNSPQSLKRYRALCAYLVDPADDGFAVIERRAAEVGAPLVRIEDRGAFDFGVARRLADLCRRERPAIWHGHDYKSNFFGLRVRRQVPMRLVSTAHGWVHRTPRMNLYYALDRWCLKRYERVLCVSPDLYEACRKAGVPEERCLYVPNGIDTDSARRRRSVAEAQRDAGVPEGRRVIGAFGRLEAEKGFDLLLRAAALLSQEGIDLEVWIGGEGAEAARLEQLAGELGLGERFRLLGFVDDPMPLYESLDAFVLSSLREGLPNVLLEAMAMETPVVASRVGAVADVLSDGDHGVLVEPGSAPGLARGIRAVLGDREHAAGMAAAARALVELRYSFRRRMRLVESIYDDLLAD